MSGRYDHLDREALLRQRERRDAMRRDGLVSAWEGIGKDRVLNQGYVVQDLDPTLSTHLLGRGWLAHFGDRRRQLGRFAGLATNLCGAGALHPDRPTLQHWEPGFCLQRQRRRGCPISARYSTKC